MLSRPSNSPCFPTTLALYFLVFLLITGCTSSSGPSGSGAQTSNPTLNWKVSDDAFHPSARYGHTLTIIGNDIYLFGGEDNKAAVQGSARQVLDELWKFNKDNSQWEKKAPPFSPSPRQGHLAVSYQGRLWVFGGFGGMSGGEPVFLNDLWTYNPATGGWTQINPQPDQDPAQMPKGLSTPTWQVINGKLYVIGGSDKNGGLKSTFIYNFATNRWTRGSDCPVGDSGQMYGMASTTYNGNIYTFGTTNEPYRYNPAADTWLASSTIGDSTHGKPAQRWEPSYTQVGENRCLMSGGMSEGGATLLDQWVLENGQQWRYVNPTGDPFTYVFGGAFGRAWEDSTETQVFSTGGMTDGGPVYSRGDGVIIGE